MINLKKIRECIDPIEKSDIGYDTLGNYESKHDPDKTLSLSNLVRLFKLKWSYFNGISNPSAPNNIISFKYINDTLNYMSQHCECNVYETYDGNDVVTERYMGCISYNDKKVELGPYYASKLYYKKERCRTCQAIRTTYGCSGNSIPYSVMKLYGYSNNDTGKIHNLGGPCYCNVHEINNNVTITCYINYTCSSNMVYKDKGVSTFKYQLNDDICSLYMTTKATALNAGMTVNDNSTTNNTVNTDESRGNSQNFIRVDRVRNYKRIRVLK